MASAWGTAWGSAWGNAWGLITTSTPELEPEPSYGGWDMFNTIQVAPTEVKSKRKRDDDDIILLMQ